MIRESVTNTNRTGVIFDVKRYAIHDGAGIRTTVFFKGCPLRCRWCHNPESWDPRPEHATRPARCLSCGECVQACPRGATTLEGARPAIDSTRCALCGKCVDACSAEAREIIGQRVSPAEVVSTIEKDTIFHDQSGGGVTFSGGEPLMQADFLHELLLECRRRDVHSTVDTSCYAQPQVIERISADVDLFLCDLKHMDSAAHERLTGVTNEAILDNIRRLALAGREIVIRMPVVAGLNDDETNVDVTARFVASLGGVSRIDVLPYNPGGSEKSVRLESAAEMPKFRPPSDERIEEMVGQLQSFGFAVRVGG